MRRVWRCALRPRSGGQRAESNAAGRPIGREKTPKVYGVFCRPVIKTISRVPLLKHSFPSHRRNEELEGKLAGLSAAVERGEAMGARAESLRIELHVSARGVGVMIRSTGRKAGPGFVCGTAERAKPSAVRFHGTDATFKRLTMIPKVAQSNGNRQAHPARVRP